LAMLPRRIAPTLDGTLISIASLPFEEELHPFSTAEPAERIVVSRHVIPSSV
jgi:hypothetical protein